VFGAQHYGNVYYSNISNLKYFTVRYNNPSKVLAPFWVSAKYEQSRFTWYFNTNVTLVGEPKNVSFIEYYENPLYLSKTAEYVYHIWPSYNYTLGIHPKYRGRGGEKINVKNKKYKKNISEEKINGKYYICEKMLAIIIFNTLIFSKYFGKI